MITPDTAIGDIWVEYILKDDGRFTFYMCPMPWKVEVAEKLIALGRMDLVTEEYGGTLPNTPAQ